MIKKGDLVNPSEAARRGFKDVKQINFPCEVMHVFTSSTGKRVIQFLCNSLYTKGAMQLREWDERWLVPHEPVAKPHFKLVAVKSLVAGDVILAPSTGQIITVNAYIEHMVGQIASLLWTPSYEGRTHVWKQTTLQKETGVPSGNGRPDTCQGDGWKTTHIQTLGRGLRLDARSRVSHACESERECNASRDVESVPESGTPLRMTLGRYLKSGNYIAFEVKNDGAYPYYVVGGVGHIINPDQYFKVVKPITKT